MVPAEFVAQDHAYRMLKQRLLARPQEWIDPINIMALAEALGFSRTPVREALFRLLGEGVIQSAEPGSYRLFLPGPSELADLYGWSQHLMLIVISAIAPVDLIASLHGWQERISVSPSSGALRQMSAIFETLANATGNGEISKQVRNLQERFVGLRLAETKVFGDNIDEVGRIARTSDSDIKNKMRRKIITYHRRRFHKIDAISKAISRL